MEFIYKEKKTPQSLKKPISAKSWNIYTLLLKHFLCDVARNVRLMQTDVVFLLLKWTRQCGTTVGSTVLCKDSNGFTEQLNMIATEDINQEELLRSSPRRTEASTNHETVGWKGADLHIETVSVTGR